VPTLFIFYFLLLEIVMDASDTIRKRKAKAIYFDKKTKLVKAQPNADCNSCTNYSTCIVTFSTYEEKLLFKEGRKLCKCAQQ